MVSNGELQQQLNNSITRIEQLINNNHDTISKKIDGLSGRLDNYETRISKLEADSQTTANRLEELDEQVESKDEVIDKLIERIESLEEKIEKLENLPVEVKQLQEDMESRTNRQLRETLVFRNVPELNNEETYAQTKQLLATTINEVCPDISYESALAQIKRAHRESNHRRYGDGEQSRAGRRHIFAAFHSWEMCQTIINTFRLKGVNDRQFTISADQKYGPMTNKRRHLAYQLRKTLRANGTITSGFVDFPAKLMVNYPGDVAQNGNKVYKMHTNFSRHDVRDVVFS